MNSLDERRNGTGTSTHSPLLSSHDWRVVAREHLTSLIAQVASVDALRDEAAKTRAALLAAGVADVPTLPWVAPKPAPAAGRPATYPTCVRCGRQFTHGIQYVKDAPGGPCCRNPVTCAANREQNAVAVSA